MASKKLSLPEFLKVKRHEAGLSQGDVSRYLRYHTPQFISNWERGVAAPPIDSIKTLAKLYKIDAEELFEVMLGEALRQTTEDLKRKFKGSSR